MPIASPLVRAQVMDSRDGVLIGQKVWDGDLEQAEFIRRFLAGAGQAREPERPGEDCQGTCVSRCRHRDYHDDYSSLLCGNYLYYRSVRPERLDVAMVRLDAQVTEVWQKWR